MKANKKGFTLTEVITVLVIVVLAAVIIVPNVVGYASRLKRRNCTDRIESLLTNIQSACAPGRYSDINSVRAKIISALSDFDDSVKNTVPTSSGLVLRDFCNGENDVTVTWTVEEDRTGSAISGFDVKVKAICNDGIKGENSFYCGYKSSYEGDDKSLLSDALFLDILQNNAVKSAYDARDYDALLKAVANVSNTDVSKFSAAKNCLDGLTFSDDQSKINAALELYLTAVLNENKWFKSAFTANYYGADYMPVLVFDGSGSVYGESGTEYSKLKFGEGCFILCGARGETTQSLFTDGSITSDGEKIKFSVNCVWSPQSDRKYFMSEIENDGVPVWIPSDEIPQSIKNGSSAGDAVWTRV